MFHFLALSISNLWQRYAKIGRLPHQLSFSAEKTTQRSSTQSLLRKDDLLYFLPLCTITLFALLMGATLWSLEKREQKQQQEILYRDATWARHKIRSGLLRAQEHINLFVRNIASDDHKPLFYRATAQDLLLAHPEILAIGWLSTKKQKLWLLPQDFWGNNDIDNNNYAILETAKAAMLSQKPTYSMPIRDKTQHYMIYSATPIVRGNKKLGVIGNFYSVAQILQTLTPPELTDSYRFSLLSADGFILASSTSRPLSSNAKSYVAPLDPPYQMLNLQVTAYPVINDLTNHILLTLVCGLSCFLFWSFGRLWRQSQTSKITQRALQAETAFRRSMENSMALGMRALDMSGRIIYVNPAFCHMTGLEESDLIGKSPPFPYWPRANLDQLNHYLTLTLQGAAPHAGFQGPIQRRDGTIFYAQMEVSPLIDGNNKQIGWMGSMSDITESKRAREELVLAYARFTTLLESLDASVSVLSPANTTLLFANRYYQQIFNNEARGHLELCKLDTTQVNEDLDNFYEDMANPSYSERIRAASAAREMYLRMRTTATAREVYLPDLQKWFDVRHRYIRWVDGNLAHVVIATDISARKHAEEVAHHREEELQFASRLTAMGEMASLLAHELNQPLGAITNYCMGAITRVRSETMQTRSLLLALEKISDQAIRASTIVSRIRSFVKRSVPQQRAVNIYDVIADAVGLTEIAITRQNTRIITDIPAELPQIWLDPLLIEQVLMNLLKNAAEAMSQMNTNCAVHPHNTVKLVARLAKGSLSPGLLLSIIDHGPGINEANHERLFEPFYSTKSDGMGMGLNICRSVIESHHGRLWVENNPDGKGCTFFVLLPLSNPNDILKKRANPC